MGPRLQRLTALYRIGGLAPIARRYFITNGFDGALTMLGLIIGFRLTGDLSLEAAFWACVGTAIALASSGISSAYISESAERQKQLRELEKAMAVPQPETSIHGHAARFAPLIIALVNGGAPLLLAVIIIMPIWLSLQGLSLPLGPYDTSIIVAFSEIFLLGAFLGRISGIRWYWMGLRTLLIATMTAVIILIVGH